MGESCRYPSPLGERDSSRLQREQGEDAMCKHVLTPARRTLTLAFRACPSPLKE